MQCTSYTPVYYHARDLNVGGSGYAWQLYDSNGSFAEERSYNISLPLCDQYSGYDKEMLKQIIQNHEATFRFQVQELHRLYKRQRDLMDEMRVRELFAQHLLSRTSESIHFSSRVGAGFSQKPSPATNWLIGNLSSSKLSEPTSGNARGHKSFAAENFQKPSTLQTDSFIRRNGESDAKFLWPKSERKGNEVIDLEFAADTYDDQVKTCRTPEKVSNFHLASHSGISKTWELSSFTSDIKKENCFFDLNEPIQLESLSGPLEAFTGHSETVCNDECVPVEATPQSTDPIIHSLKSGGSSDGKSSSMAIDLNSMPANCCSETEMKIESSPDEDDEAIVHNDSTDSQLKKESCIDLNSGVVDEHCLTPSSPAHQIKSAEFMEVKGPVSPENEERSPPRGISEDTQLETPLSSEQGEGEPSVELETAAAQTLVTIFYSGVQECTGVAVLGSLENFGNLCWFAEIVSSTGDKLESTVMKSESEAAENDEGEEDTLNSSRFNKGKGRGKMSRRSGKGQNRGKKQSKGLKTEDVHVEGFLETSPLKRKAGRNGCAKPRKCSRLSSSDVTKKSLSSILKQSGGSSEQDAVQSWGKTRKRGGGRKRSRASKFFLTRGELA